MKKLTIIIGLSFCFFAGLITAAERGSEIQPDNLFPRVKLDTKLGDIIIELDRTRAPIASNNFLSYVASGRYDGTVFHRLVHDFVLQGGGYDLLYNPIKEYEPIYNESGNGLKNEMYTIGMAREKEPHSATSQFYFNLGDNDNLDPGKDWGYTVFGMVMEGSDVVDSLARAQTDVHPKLGWGDVPKINLVLTKASIIPEKK